MKKYKLFTTRETADALKPKVSHSRSRAMVRDGIFPNAVVKGHGYTTLIPESDITEENKRRKKLGLW